MSRTHTAVTDTSIVAVSAYSLLLHQQYRDTPEVGAPAGGLGAGRKDASSNRRPPKQGSGGAAGWFLFLLKLIGVLAFVAFAVAAYVSLTFRHL